MSRDEQRDGPKSAAEDGDVGSVAEEAARLLGAFSEAFAEQAAPTGDAGGDRPEAPVDEGLEEGIAAFVRRAAGALREVDAHVATGSEECRWCPVCRGIDLVRETSPEVRSHLLGAARSLLAAGTILVDELDVPASEEPSAAPGPPRRSRRPGTTPPPTTGVEHIDLDDGPSGPQSEESPP